jgi:hypothetical protein
MDGIERRHTDRLKILGANVVYTLKNGQFGLKPLIDITRSSACLEVDHPINKGEFIELEVIIPGRTKIFIKGTVTRLSDPISERPAYIVVQFLPFGTDERYNSMECYQQLIDMIEQYLLPVEFPK